MEMEKAIWMLASGERARFKWCPEVRIEKLFSMLDRESLGSTW